MFSPFRLFGDDMQLLEIRLRGCQWLFQVAYTSVMHMLPGSSWSHSRDSTIRNGDNEVGTMQSNACSLSSIEADETLPTPKEILVNGRKESAIAHVSVAYHAHDSVLHRYAYSSQVTQYVEP